MFENRVLRRIFGPKREEVIGEWRKLHNEELYNFEVRHPRCVGSITKNICVLHIQSNTTIFHLVVQ